MLIARACFCTVWIEPLHTMQYLAQTKDAPGVDWSAQEATLRDEARRVHELWKGGTIRQIWFTEEGDAVLLLESATKAEANAAMQSLPLIKNGLLTYSITQLSVYSGFDRLIGGEGDLRSV